MIYLIYFYLLWNAFYAFLIPAYHTPVTGVLSLVDEAIALVLLAHLLIYVLRNGRIPDTPAGKPLAWILLLSLLSYLVNLGSPVNAVQFIFSIVKPIIIFYWIVTFIRDDQVERFIVKMLVVLIVLQIPFFFYGFGTKGLAYTGDNAKGAVGDSTMVGTIMWLGVVLSTVYYVSTKKRIYVAGILLCMALLAITSTKQIYIFLPVVLVVVLRKQLQLSVKKIAVLLAVGAGLLFAMYSTVEKAWIEVESGGKSAYGDWTLVELVEGSEKLQGYYSAIFELPGELPFPVLGAGPGQYGSYTAMFSRTPLAQKYIMYYDDITSQTGTGTLYYRSSGIIAIYGDIGIISLMIFLLMYYYLFKAVTAYGVGSPSPFRKAVSALASASCMLVLWQSLVFNIFEGNIFILNFFWVLAGSVLSKRDDATMESKPIAASSSARPAIHG